MAEDKECVFCKIVRGEIPTEKVYEDSQVFAFLDINPVNYGHLLVIPKGHYQWMQDVPDELLGKIFVRCKKLMRALKKEMEADFVVVSVVGTDVPHFHIHLLPRYRDDGLADFWPTKKYESGKDKEVAEKIRAELR